MERNVPLKFKNADGTFTTLPDDTRQLCGYDFDGNEVYEGDELLSDEGVLFIADKRGQAGRYCRDFDEETVLIVFGDTDINELTLRSSERGSCFNYERMREGGK